MEYTQTWAAMEAMHHEGKSKAIGVSNFTTDQLDHLIRSCTVRPAVNQVEVHPYLPQQQLHDFCNSNGITVMGYSPLGSSADRAPVEHGCVLLQHPVVTSIAQELAKSPAQVLIRY